VTQERLWSLVHRDAGPVCTFLTEDEAERERDLVLRDEPGWADDLWVEPFQLEITRP
jgi:hypothetical protein